MKQDTPTPQEIYTVIANLVYVKKQYRDGASAIGYIEKAIALINKLERERDEAIQDYKAISVAMLQRAERAEHLADKYKWQVRDTCVRAEKAEAALTDANKRVEEAEAERDTTIKIMEGGWRLKSVGLQAALAERDAEIARLKSNVGHLERGFSASEGVIADREAEVKEWFVAASPYATPQALKEGIARLREDAERYRWLREQNTVPYPSDLNPGELQNLIVFWDDGQALDAAIDAARKGGE